MEICEICGGKNLQVKYWVELNSKKVIRSSDDDADLIWCSDCEQEIDTKEGEPLIGNQITSSMAIRFWNNKAIYAYDKSLKIDWQINHDNECNGAYQVIDEVLKNGCILFID